MADLPVWHATKEAIDGMSPLKYASYKFPVVNPVAVGSIIREFIDEEMTE